MPVGVCALAQAVILWYMFAFIRPAGEQAFLHYSAVLGVDLVGPWWRLIFLPLVGAGIIAINFIFSFWLYDKDRFLSRLLSIGAAACLLGLVFAMYLMTILNS